LKTGGIFSNVIDMPYFRIDLRRSPKIAQVGLSLHGSRSVESFQLHGLWSLHAYRYQGKICVDGNRFPLKGGCVSLIPPEKLVEWSFPSHAPHYYVHFEMQPSDGVLAELPLLQNLGENFDRFCDQFEQLIQFQMSDPERASIRLWDMIYQLKCEPTGFKSGQPMHPSLQIALSIVRSQLSNDIQVGRMARSMGVSHNHLTTLFLRHFGCGAREYIQRERLKRACHLLTHSSLSIKSIAIETGIPDLHYFNKSVRKYTGQSPSEYRRHHGKSN
jgi:AraC family transcriptional regulator